MHSLAHNCYELFGQFSLLAEKQAPWLWLKAHRKTYEHQSNYWKWRGEDWIKRRGTFLHNLLVNFNSSLPKRHKRRDARRIIAIGNHPPPACPYCRFLAISDHCFDNYLYIFHKTEVHTVILRCWTCLNLNWFKSHVTKCKYIFLDMTNSRTVSWYITIIPNHFFDN